MVLKNLLTKKQWRNRHREQTYGHGERGGEGEMYGKSNMEKCIQSVQFCGSVVSDSLQPRGLQHARSPCPSPTPGVHSNSCPLSQWCHPTISSFHPLLLQPSVFPSIGSFQMSQFFTSGGQSIGVSVSTSVLPMNIQDWFPVGWTSWISLQSQESYSTPQFKNINSWVLSFLHGPTLTTIHDYWKNHSFD